MVQDTTMFREPMFEETLLKLKDIYKNHSFLSEGSLRLFEEPARFVERGDAWSWSQVAGSPRRGTGRRPPWWPRGPQHPKPGQA